jgi:hypothetical protein
MPKHSKIVDHEHRAAIERGLAVGVPVKQLAHKYGLSLDCLYRYKAQIPVQLKAAHMGARLKAGADLEKMRLEESEGILQQLATQRARLLLSQDHAIEIGDARLVALLAGEIHRGVKLIGQFLGEFAQHSIKTHVSVLIQPEYLQLRSRLIAALTPYPAARSAVVKAFQEVEKAAATPPPPPMIEGTVERETANA